MSKHFIFLGILLESPEAKRSQRPGWLLKWVLDILKILIALFVFPLHFNQFRKLQNEECLHKTCVWMKSNIFFYILSTITFVEHLTTTLNMMVETKWKLHQYILETWVSKLFRLLKSKSLQKEEKMFWDKENVTGWKFREESSQQALKCKLSTTGI